MQLTKKEIDGSLERLNKKEYLSLKKKKLSLINEFFSIIIM